MTGNEQARGESYLAAILDAVREPAAIIGLEREIVAANSQYRERYPKKPSSSQLHCFEINHGFPCPCIKRGERCPIQLSSESGKSSQVRHIHLGFHGRDLEMITVHPVHDSKGKITAFFQTLRPAGILRPVSLSLLAGESREFKKMLQSIEAMAPLAAPVLIRGEAGSGKEVVARTLYRLSPQRANRFVAMDCTGLSERAFVSDLFGRETPLRHDVLIKRGLVEVAQGGILFLNELVNIGLSPQVMLLVLLETGTFRRSGGSKILSAEVRLVCSTQYDLEQKVEERAFSQILFDCISRYTITVPPLRERLQDLPNLTRNLLHHLSRGRVTEISPAALSVLRQHSFPGNIRELISLLEYACMFADGSTVSREHLPPEL